MLKIALVSEHASPLAVIGGVDSGRQNIYVAHVAKMFKLLGEDQGQALVDAATVLDIENGLAEASRTRVELRDPDKNYNKRSLVGNRELVRPVKLFEEGKPHAEVSFDICLERA